MVIVPKNLKMEKTIIREHIRGNLLYFCVVNGYRSCCFPTQIQSLAELLEAHLLIKLSQIFKMGTCIGDIVQANLNRCIGIDGRKGLGQVSLLLVVDEIFLHFGRLHLVNMLVNAIKRPVL